MAQRPVAVPGGALSNESSDEHRPSRQTAAQQPAGPDRRPAGRGGRLHDRSVASRAGADRFPSVPDSKRGLSSCLYTDQNAAYSKSGPAPEAAPADGSLDAFKKTNRTPITSGTAIGAAVCGSVHRLPGSARAGSLAGQPSSRQLRMGRVGGSAIGVGRRLLDARAGLAGGLDTARRAGQFKARQGS
jgi:hypothetical protein